jgi:hypothetical protein
MKLIPGSLKKSKIDKHRPRLTKQGKTQLATSEMKEQS